ncbi:Ig-like domain-containing protein [Sediminicola sp. YIK13]|uniref:Ig-like domain-containing protein n=1 Tax=Sediminicola sp. YIK13 TaxID=1453352 RepID=UPI001F1887F8|nr:Ig-like domain-containing protein [Sediminicola sp. YIK13]
MVLALAQCAKRGTPSGGDKDTTPPKLLRAEPENMTINFKAKKIRLYFDEYIKLKDVQKQLIVSPPLKYNPLITPQGSASKFIEITIKDTLKENTTYTLNFGQSITDNNEGNPNSFLTYVFSTGNYIDSLSLSGAVQDAFKKKVDQFVSVMLYELDSSYTDSTIYKRPPNYITNTLDSATTFKLNYLKEGKYALFAVKDEGKNNLFDQKVDKIGFVTDTISLPTDSIYALTLFKEIPDYQAAVPSYAAKNKIIFGYQGIAEHIVIEPLTKLPDTIKTKVLKETGKDTLNYWFTPFETDSIVFQVTNEKWNTKDTFTVKSRKLVADSLVLTPNQNRNLAFEEPFYISANIPIVQIDSSKIALLSKDSIPVKFSSKLDSVLNRVTVDFALEPNERYTMDLLPGAISDFFGTENDTLAYTFSTNSYADYGNLGLNLVGNPTYPLIIQLTDETGKTKREIYATEPKAFQFNHLKPAKYMIRIIYDSNTNGKWDTGSFLQKISPEKVIYYPTVIEVRANWELIESFNLLD